MSKYILQGKITRRDFLKLGGGALAVAAGAKYLPQAFRASSPGIAEAAPALQALPPDIHLAATDGWIYLPGQVPIPGAPGYFYNPDDFAPSLFTTYMFGFRNVTGLTSTQVQAQKMKCQATAPLFWVNEGDEYRIKLSNLGLQMRPDLVDEHTLHWHGFRNAYPVFDGEPHSSLAVPIGRSMTLYYQPGDPGTYMYHCHFEETEHVHMGMTGLVFVRPLQDQTPLNPGERYAYNDGDGTTAFEREFAVCLTDVWAEAHWDDSHVQLPDWTDFKPDFWLMNGRVYPDTLAPAGGGTDVGSGDLIAPTGRPELQYQPITSLIEANEGDRILLRFVNLGFQQFTMTTPGLKMKVVGMDATFLRNSDGTDLAYETNSVLLGVGQSYDVIITAPAVSSATSYLLYNRQFSRLHNGGSPGYGGQMTEIRIHPAGTLAAQTAPNTNPRP